MRKITKIRRSIRAISPVISVLLMIAIAVVASLFAYAWVMGFIGNKTSQAGKEIQIQSYTSQGNLVVYVQNTGQGLVHLKQDGSVYVNDVLKNIVSHDDILTGNGELIPIEVGQTVKLEVDYQPQPNEQLRIKIVTVEGTIMEITGNSGSGNSGTGLATVTFSAGPGGTVSPSGTISGISVGISYQIYAYPDSGYVFSSWTFSGPIYITNPTSASTKMQVTGAGAGTVKGNFVSATNPKLVFTAGAGQTLTENVMSDIVTVQRQQDSSGSITVNLATTSSGTFYDSTGSTVITSLTIASQGGSASFRYKDATAGTPTLTASASASGYSPVSTTFTIQEEAPPQQNLQLAYIAGASQTLTVNHASSVITVQRQTESGAPYTTGSINVGLTATSGNFYSDAECLHQITSVAIDDSAHSASFYYKASVAGSPTLTASAAGYTETSTTFTINPETPTAQVTFAVNPAGSGTTNPSGTQTYNIGASIPISASANTGYAFSSWTFTGDIQISSATSASTNAQINGAGTITANFISTTGNKLVFTAGTSQTLVVYEPSAKITVQRQYANGNPITSGDTYVSLATTSSGGEFYSDAACQHQITSSIRIRSGYNSIDIYYRDSNTGTPTITASVTSGYQPVSTTFTISAATPEIKLTTGFDGPVWDSEWRSWPNPPWTSTTEQYYSAPSSATATSSTQGAFSGNKVDATGAAYITVSFYFRITGTNPNDFQIRYGATRTDNYYSVDWHNLGVNLGDQSVYTANAWHYYSINITDTSAFTDYFRFQFLSQSLSSNAQIWVDNVQIVVNK